MGVLGEIFINLFLSNEPILLYSYPLMRFKPHFSVSLQRKLHLSLKICTFVRLFEILNDRFLRLLVKPLKLNLIKSYRPSLLLLLALLTLYSLSTATRVMVS